MRKYNKEIKYERRSIAHATAAPHVIIQLPEHGYSEEECHGLHESERLTYLIVSKARRKIAQADCQSA